MKLVLTFLALAGCASAAAPVATARLTEVSSVSQYGLTWEFDRPVAVGRFVNGDYYVVGPITLVSIHPRPLVGSGVPESELGEREQARVRGGRYVRNGSMLNPPASREVAYDSGIRNYFKPELVATPPIRLQPGDSLVSTISLKKGEAARFPYHSSNKVRDEHDNSPVKTAAILTCVAEPQPEDAFRPAYADRGQKIYLARDLKRDLLPRLKPPPNTPNVETWIGIFQRPWVNTCFFGFEQPMENMPHYGQWVGQAQSMAGLLLTLDLKPELKERLLVNVVQVGIDYWGLVRNGHPGWPGHGGHGSGRKFPIVFAGLMLGDEQMASPTRSFPKAEFGEDNQTMHGQGWTGATALFAGHSGIRNATGQPERSDWGPYEHLHPRDWARSNRQSEAYRRANTSSSWVGQALVMRLLRAEHQWNHDPFFNYVDRWMTEPNDREHRQEIMKHQPGFRLEDRATHVHQGNTWEPFVRTMWDRFRSMPEARPTTPARHPTKP
jgi:hypothetical protein